jgi:hypothetical protein
LLPLGDGLADLTGQPKGASIPTRASGLVGANEIDDLLVPEALDDAVGSDESALVAPLDEDRRRASRLGRKVEADRRHGG